MESVGTSHQATKQTLTFKVVGDCPIRADVYALPGTVARPVILWIHGGALIMGNRGQIDPTHFDAYARAGFTVVSIDYRLAPETKLAGIIEDVRDAFRWVRQKLPAIVPIDPNRIAVVGHSAGGYLTLMTGYSVGPRPRALVSFYGYGDVSGAWYGTPNPFHCQLPPVSKEQAHEVVGKRVISADLGQTNRQRFYHYCRQQGVWPKEISGFDPHTQPQEFDRFCPLRNVTSNYPPTLLLHGDQDEDVPYEQSVDRKSTRLNSS